MRDLPISVMFRPDPFFSLLALVCCLAFVADLIGRPAYPLKMSVNKRYLVDQNNRPFLMIGDAPHSLLVKLTTADAALYLHDRASHGINTLWVELLCTPYVNGRPDGSLLNGMVPFTNKLAGEVYDFTTPNESYFRYVDAIVRMAGTNGIQLLLDSLETGDWTSVALANGTNRCLSYGRYLGQRYKNFTNIIWITGNDFQTWRNPADDAVVTAVARGIKDRDQNHLQTVELNYELSESMDDPQWWPIIRLNGVYSYYPSYAESLNAYNRTNFVPVYLLEAHYEFEDLQGEMGTPNVLRRQEYWSLLAGAKAGYIGGNSWTWRFSPGWQDYLNSPGVAHLQHFKSLFSIRAWYNLIPDQKHTIVTSGYGTFQTFGNVSDSDYATAAATSDGSLAICYMPTIRTIRVNMTRMAGTTLARWFDPTSGRYMAATGSPFPNVGTRAFTPPGKNGDGDTDWILVLETMPPETQPPAVGLLKPTQGARLSGVVAISATATDNIGVIGVQFQVDGANLGGEVRPAPYKTVWNTLNVTNGVHSVQAVARDLAGNRKAARVSVTVSNAFPPSLFPVAAYSFDENSGTIVNDDTGNGNTGTISDPAWTSSSRGGSALSFTGSNSVTVNDSAFLDLSSNGVTVEAWVYPTSLPIDWATIVLKEVPDNMAYGLLLYAESGLMRPEMYVRTSADVLRGVQGEYGLPLNTWTHIAGTYDGVNVQLYVNGYVNRNQLAGPPAAFGGIITSAEPLRIGGNSIWGEYFTGTIDELRIYNRALAQNEIQRDMTMPLTAPVSILSATKPSNSLEIWKLSNSHIRLRLRGTPGRPFQVEASVDLQSWQMIESAVVSPDGTFDFEDTDTGYAHRFYRCVTP